MWIKLNDTILKHEFSKSNFKEFMANNASTNWNVVKIVYESRDPSMRMFDKECTCLFHWIQLFDRHTK